MDFRCTFAVLLVYKYFFMIIIMDKKILALSMVVFVAITGFILWKSDQEMKDDTYPNKLDPVSESGRIDIDGIERPRNDSVQDLHTNNFSSEHAPPFDHKPIFNMTEEEKIVFDNCRDNISYCEDYCSINPEASFCHIRSEEI